MIEIKGEKIGLTEKQFQLIKDAIASFNEIEKVVIFGSRATGKYKPSSDIDLAIFGKNINDITINRLANTLEDLPLPFTFDIIDYNKIVNRNLKRKINIEGKTLFEKEINNIPN